jgi:hypothetical protein
MSSSRFFWISLIRWGVALVITFILIIELVYPSSFGILPSFRLWKLVFNSVALVGWIIGFGYFGKKISLITSAPRLTSYPFYKMLIVNIAGYIGILLLFMMDVLTDGKSLDATIQFGIFMGLLFGIVPILQTFLSWLIF